MKTQRAASKAATVKKRNNNKSKAGAAYKVDTFKVPENPTLDDIKHAVGLQELDARVKDAKESCWETESLLEDALAELGDAKLSSDGRSQFSLTLSLPPNYPDKGHGNTMLLLALDYVFFPPLAFC